MRTGFCEEHCVSLPEKTMQSNQRGVTFIELLVTMAVLAITVAMAIPAFTEARTRAEVRALSGEVVSALRWGRSEAMRTNQTATIKLGAGATCADTTAAAWSITIGTQVVRCSSLADFNTRYPKAAPLSVSSIAFTSRGMVNTPVAAYTISSVASSAFRTISIEMAGRVTEAG
jgi:prepilin-type N-terminal cleavage/methylation domain-containing protein